MHACIHTYIPSLGSETGLGHSKPQTSNIQHEFSTGISVPANPAKKSSNSVLAKHSALVVVVGNNNNSHHKAADIVPVVIDGGMVIDDDDDDDDNATSKKEMNVGEKGYRETYK